ncbi:NADH:ubiquinone oxidoreductase [Marasmius crinis-equi]|uniref:NADH:ubiquinone oxidoreductase n=1 Tax=Marasmius crinis-equi TaxID=585013 RepID=A0ABR3FUW5_9AGAR
MSDTLLPGQPIPIPKGPTPKLGSGTYIKDSQVRASLVGIPSNEGSTLTISRVRPRPPASNSVVLGSVTRLSPLQALLSITVVDGVPLPPGEEFTGVIRSQDVRATEKDKVKIGDCFRGGDVVRGLVISLGDARSYFVTTARNDLGVIFATSEAGATMEPVSWQEMRCPKTGSIEKRNYSSSTDWRAKYEEVAEMLTETRAELDEFHTASKELEAELENELQRTEKAQQDLKVKVAKAENERDEWKSKFMSLQTTHNSTTTSLQRELDQLRQEHQKLKIQFRELEMGNDDLERTERAVSSSLADVEAKYSRALEEKILLEHELLDKANVEEQSQRLKDELRDANAEISILKDQLAARVANSSETSLNSKSLPHSSNDDLLSTPAPSDLQLSELESSESLAESSSAGEQEQEQELTPRKPTTTITTTPRSTGQSALLHRAGFQPGKSFATPPNGSSIPRSSTLPSLYSSSPRSPVTSVPRPIVTRHPSVASNASSTSTTTAKSKGVQMVSEMRARVKNLEQKIHTRVPRLRLGSMTNRPVFPSSALSPTQSPSSRTLLGRSSIEKPVVRKSNDSKRSTDGESEKSKKETGESSGWVLIMEDSPSPPRDRRSSRSGTSRSSTSSSSSPTPESSKSSFFQSTISGGLRRPQSRLSGGSTTTGSSIPTPTSRPATPTLLPLPSSALHGAKRSTGPGSSNYLAQPKRSSLGSSTTTPALGKSTRERPITMPPVRRSPSPSKALPGLPIGHENVTVRRVPPSSSASALAQSRIGRPSGGASRRRSSVEGTNTKRDASKPRAGSAAGP